MNNNESKTLWIALFAGLFAAFLLYSYSQEKKAEYDKSYGTLTNVVVAKKDIAEFQTIDDSMVEISQKPDNFKEPGVVTDPESIIGRVAAAPIKAGEQVLSNKLLHPGPDTGVSLQVAPTKRAMALPIDEVRAVAKLIRPGDRVDVLIALDSGKGQNSRRDVITLLTDVPVLATGANIVNNIPRTFEIDAAKNITQISLTGDTKYTSVTVEVSPREAQDLAYMISTNPANIFFTLRNPNDKQMAQRLPSATSDSILGRAAIIDPSLAPPPVVAPPVQAPPPQQQFRPNTNGPRR